MNRHKVSFSGAAALAVMLAAHGLALPTARAAGESPADTARAIISQATGQAPGSLSVANETLLPDAGIRRFKVLDEQGELHRVDLDASGRPASPNAVARAIAQADQRGFVGKLEKDVADRLIARVAGPTTVVLWLRRSADAAALPSARGPEDERAHLAAVESEMEAAEQPVVDQLSRRGQRVIYRARYAPLVVAALDEPALRDMEARADVERIYLERVHRPRLNVSRVVVQASTVEARGINGTGVRVGVVEADRVGPHPNLPATRRILCRGTASPFVSVHKTAVAGVIQSTNATVRGIAPGVTLVDGIAGDFSDAELMAATDCVIGRGAVAVNMSFGSDTNGVFDAFSRYVDATAYNSRRTLVVAVSNDCALRMGSPEIAFNALAVGAFSDRNTTGFPDDRHTCAQAFNPRFSAFRDPISPHMDREEPDVVAPGELIDMPLAGGGFGEQSGTSFAAPHVTAAIALLQSRLAVFQTQNERARAVIMASARHNIEGASRLSERDGAGAIMLAAADRVLQNGQSWFWTKPGGLTGFPQKQTFTANAGELVRVAVVWAHKMPLGSTSTEPTTDLDLVVSRPGGAVVASSTSQDNSYEIVQFTAPVTGVYRARIVNSGPSPGTEYIGLAVSRSNS